MTAMRLKRGTGTMASLGPWQRTLLWLGVGAAGLLLFFASDTAILADVYWNSSIYEHCVVIPPVIAWLVWQRRRELVKIAPVGWWPGLAVVAFGLVCWTAGYAMGINVGRHLGLILMLQGLVLALIGPNAARALLFPIAYAFFLVPIGDQLVPPLQTLTAHLSMAMLGWSGVAADLDGIFITTQAGLFRVAEACAGVNFLIAMIALGALVANVAFESWTRRCLFLFAAIVTSVFGNGVRAWGTMMIAEYFGIEYADGFDHVFYGWFFFAILIVLLIGGAWRFFDRPPGDHGVDASNLQSPVRRAAPQVAMLMAALFVALPGAVLTARASAAVDLPTTTLLPEANEWKPAATPKDYLPNYPGADHRVIQRYRNAEGHEVDLFVALYGTQGDGHELVAVNQGAVDPENGWVWTSDMPDIAAADAAARAQRLTSPDREKRLAAVYYRLGGQVTGDPARVKWLMLRQRLWGSDRRAAAIVISAEEPDARTAIKAFLQALGPIGPMADRVTGMGEAR